MRKLKLEVAELAVESFSVSGVSRRAGTVHGRVEHLDPYATYDSTCAGGGGGATGPSNPVCIGPTYCCNPTANTTCCAPATNTCATEAYDPNCTSMEMCGV